MPNLSNVVPDDDLTKVFATYCYQSITKSDPASTTPRGIRVTDLTDLTQLTADERKEIAGLKKRTRNLIDSIRNKGEVPILLDILHDGDFLELGVHYNSPSWATRIAEALKDTSYTRVLLAGYKTTIREIKVLTQFMNFHSSPLARYHAGKKRWCFQEANLMPIGDIQNLGFQRKISFYNLPEYLTIQYLTFAKEKEIMTADIREFNSTRHIVHLVSCPTVQKKSVYYGYINYITEGNFRPRAGDIFKLSFNENEDFDKPSAQYWKFKVVESIGLVPSQLICGIVSRAWLKSIEAFNADDPDEIHIGVSLGLAEARQKIGNDGGNVCRLEYVQQDKVDKTVFNSFDRLIFAKRNDQFTDFTTRISRVLLARRIDLLATHDFFAVPRNAMGFDAVEELMPLNDKQKEIVRNLENARGGFTISQGPPGTGKSYTIAKTCIPFLIMPGRGVHVIVCPSNAGVDDIAVNVHREIENLVQRNDPDAEYPFIYEEHKCYVVRLHSKGSEKAIQNLAVTENVPPPSNARPPTFAEDIEHILKDLSEAQEMVHNMIYRSQETLIPHIYDARVKEMHLSAGAYMLRSTGFWPDGNGGYLPAWPDFEEKHSRFIALLKRKISGVTLSETLAIEMGKAAKRLFTKILQGARVLVGTTASIANTGTMEIVKDFTVALTFDENAREIEHNMLPILATRFTKNPGVHLVGDHEQLAPMAQVNQNVAVTAKQKQLALMTRLIYAGFPYTMLTEQHRMHPDIARAVSKNFYGNKLVTVPGLERRTGSGTFTALSQTILNNNRSNFFAIDFAGQVREPKPYIKYRVETNSIGSKSCEFQALYGVTLAINMINYLRTVKKQGSVAIVTPYTAQKSYYQKAQENMRVQKYEGYANLVVDTIDGAQGREFDYVILDTPIDSRIGMLDDKKRVGVAFTRARLGLAWLANFNALNSCTGNASALRAMRNHVKEHAAVRKYEDIKNWPACAYLTPGEMERPSPNLLLGEGTTDQLISAGGKITKAGPRPLQGTLTFNYGEIAASQSPPSGSFTKLIAANTTGAATPAVETVNPAVETTDTQVEAAAAPETEVQSQPEAAEVKFAATKFDRNFMSGFKGLKVIDADIPLPPKKMRRK